jgi:hypothetical protein
VSPDTSTVLSALLHAGILAASALTPVLDGAFSEDLSWSAIQGTYSVFINTSEREEDDPAGGSRGEVDYVDGDLRYGSEGPPNRHVGSSSSSLGLEPPLRSPSTASRDVVRGARGMQLNPLGPGPGLPQRCKICRSVLVRDASGSTEGGVTGTERAAIPASAQPQGHLDIVDVRPRVEVERVLAPADLHKPIRE